MQRNNRNDRQLSHQLNKYLSRKRTHPQQQQQYINEEESRQTYKRRKLVHINDMQFVKGSKSSSSNLFPNSSSSSSFIQQRGEIHEKHLSPSQQSPETSFEMTHKHSCSRDITPEPRIVSSFSDSDASSNNWDDDDYTMEDQQPQQPQFNSYSSGLLSPTSSSLSTLPYRDENLYYSTRTMPAPVAPIISRQSFNFDLTSRPVENDDEHMRLWFAPK
jgi:hypothetical protein